MRWSELQVQVESEVGPVFNEVMRHIIQASSGSDISDLNPTSHYHSYNPPYNGQNTRRIIVSSDYYCIDPN